MRYFDSEAIDNSAEQAYGEERRHFKLLDKPKKLSPEDGEEPVTEGPLTVDNAEEFEEFKKSRVQKSSGMPSDARVLQEVEEGLAPLKNFLTASWYDALLENFAAFEFSNLTRC